MSERHAFLTQSQGNLGLLEQALVALADAGVEHIHALHGCAYDAQAVIRGRVQRFPRAAAPGEARFADYVLASVLSGVVEAPEGELIRNDRLAARVQVHPGPARVQVGPYAVAVGEQAAEGVRLVVRPDRARRRLDLGRAVPRLDPGHLQAANHEGEPATFAVVEATGGGLVVHFLAPDGSPVERPQTVPLS
ncbi:MAG: hypothetical protein KC613_23115 [Myxococcales bacterium]|nr:hypothetical protein [Myxococcales bacterium]MCB9521990.1 hypothetical protein [Myxococcales bacterium]